LHGSDKPFFIARHLLEISLGQPIPPGFGLLA
jgi:hypothetical protein